MNDKDLYQDIKSLTSLQPSPEVDKFFRQLVSFAEKEEKISLTKEELRDMQQLCARGECLLEEYYAKKIFASSTPKEEIASFPYYGNYKDLTNLEFQNMLQCKEGGKIKRCLFVGGGPLPLTALMLADRYGVQVSVLEKDKDAYTLSFQVMKALGFEKKVEIIFSDASTFDEYHHFDCIYLAALVGDTEKEKEQTFSSLYKKSTVGTLLLLRSSFGARTMLYMPWRESFLRSFPLLLEVKPYQKICNSFFIIQKT